MSVTSVESQKPVLSLVRGLTRRIPGRRKQRVGTRHRRDGWRVYLWHPKSGSLGPMLDPVDQDWEEALNEDTPWSVQIRKADLAGIDRQWYTPWWGGVAIMRVVNGVEFPRAGGPITKWTNEDQESITLEGGGALTILEHRLVGTRFVVRDRSLGHIAWLLVDQQRIKPGGALPIVDGSPDPDGRGHQRTYESWNLANVGIRKLLKELSEVRNGPDIMFRLEWADDEHRSLQWAMHHGTQHSPRIHSDLIHDFDTTAARSPVATLQVVTDSAALASRVWVTGSGEGEGTRIARAEDLRLLDHGFLFLETVVSDPGATGSADATTDGSTELTPEQQQAAAAEEMEKLREIAAGEMAARVDAVDQITVTVRADDPGHGVHLLHAGDPAVVTIAGYLSVPDGTYQTRIIKISGGADELVTIDFQTDTWV